MNLLEGTVIDHPEGTVIAVLVTPGAKENRLFFSYQPWRKALECTIQAPAESGKANRELIRLIAEWFSVPAISISVLSGERSSRKLLLIRGISRNKVLESLPVEKYVSEK
jgi:uncharacterized protein (TIGR00251 family)